jgi:serine/threonine protein kinase
MTWFDRFKGKQVQRAPATPASDETRTRPGASEANSNSHSPASPRAAIASVGQILIPELSTQPLRVVARHEGGFGHVLIVQSDHGAKWALKNLKAGLAIDRSVLAGEASKLATLPPHANVISIVGFVLHKEERFIIFPAMNGNLRNLIGDQPLSIIAAIAVLEQVAQGLAHIHQYGLLHLDLKPENILVSENNCCVISDFGLAAFLPSLADLRALPEHVTSTLVGTVAYMSPEHFSTGRLTPRTDVFSLGIILFELLTGRHPFKAFSFSETAWRIMSEVPSFGPLERARIPSPLQTVCLACLVPWIRDF